MLARFRRPMKNVRCMMNALFETALGIKTPWFIRQIDFDDQVKTLTIKVDFSPGSRFSYPGVEGEHRVHDTQTKRYRHLNFFQHECFLEVRVPRLKLPDGTVKLHEPEWSGNLGGFTLLFEALLLLLVQHSTFQAAAELLGISWHRVHAVCERYVDRALEKMDLSQLESISVDETSCRKGHDYLTLVADAKKRRVAFVTKGKDAETIEQFAADLVQHGGSPEQIKTVSIDMSPAFIKGVKSTLPNAEITFDKFHVIAHASHALDQTRRLEQKLDPSIKGLRWPLLKDTANLKESQRIERDAFFAARPTARTTRAWVYREQLRTILDRKQPNVMERELRAWCTGVMRSKVEEMKRVAKMIRSHLAGIVAWTRSRQTNGFIEAINGLFQAAKRKARGYTRFETMRTVIFLIAGKLDFSVVNPHIQPTLAS